MRLTRRGRLAVTLTVGALGLGATAYALTRTSAGSAVGLPTRPPCTIEVGDRTTDWTRGQAMTATTVAAVGLRIGASENGVAAAVDRALRPGVDRPLDATAARAIYQGLPDVARPGRQQVALARALLGHHGPSLTCTVPMLFAAPDLDREAPGADGLTPRAGTLRVAMREVFGKQILGGFEPRGVSDGHIDGSAHYEGRAIDVFLRPVTEEHRRQGWSQAQWAVAHAERLDVATVIFDRRLWTGRRSAAGWRDYQHPSGASDNPVLMHEDHVHVEVVEGS